MEPEEKDNSDSLHLLLGDDQLFRTRAYDLLRKDGVIRIIVREGLHGSHKGKFQARPHFQFSSQSEEFMGEGLTTTQALAECLKNIKDVQVDRQIPDHDDSDPDWSAY